MQRRKLRLGRESNLLTIIYSSETVEFSWVSGRECPSFDHCAALSGQQPARTLSSRLPPRPISPLTLQRLRWAQSERVLLVAGFLVGDHAGERQA